MRIETEPNRKNPEPFQPYRLPIDHSQFGRAEITADFMYFFAIIQL